MQEAVPKDARMSKQRPADRKRERLVIDEQLVW